MNSKAFLRSVAVASGLILTSGAFAQAPRVDFPALSPAATLKQRVGLTDIEIVYSRPSMKGREIFGGLEAYGKVWRTGANTATKITFSTPVRFGGTSVPAGSYALYSIPGPDEWTVILNNVTGQWGAYTYNATNDLVRVTVKPIALSQPVETFTIDINDVRSQSATLNLVWEKSRVPVKLEFDVAATLVPQIEALMASDAPKNAQQYFNAATFYYENDLDLKKAKEWIEKATEGNRGTFYMVHLKAKILARLGDKAGAKAAAEKSIELAVAAEGPKSGFVKMNNDLINSLK
jgi:hypothetical protein